ncbi:MAG: SRPBCC family protein [Verrucomicrobiota bacterium]
MLKKILLALAAVIVIFLGIVAMQPADFRVVRSTTIAAPPAAIFAHINDFHRWPTWSPWAKLDPDMKQTYEGPDSGQGSVYSWAGNSKVGEGRMTLTDSRPNELVRIKLEFLKPFAAVNTTEFVLLPEGKGTAVTWSMAGKNNFISKAFCLFVNMDRMVGGDFEKGLAQMKSAVESTLERKSETTSGG